MRISHFAESFVVNDLTHFSFRRFPCRLFSIAYASFSFRPSPLPATANPSRASLTSTEKRRQFPKNRITPRAVWQERDDSSSDRLNRAVIRRSLLLRRDFRVQAAQAALHLEESVCLLLGPADPFGFGRFRRAFLFIVMIV
jgi:hypothetical protein